MMMEKDMILMCLCAVYLILYCVRTQGNALGESCNSETIEEKCSELSAECLESKCTCSTDSYDSNGLTNGGTCIAISNLKVTNVSVEALLSGQIKVTWKIPKNYTEYIDSFKVTWRATNGDTVNAESEILDSSRTLYKISRGLDPGRAYTVSIFSINDQTQRRSQRTTSIVRYIATKPMITSGIDQSNSDKDASDDRITIAWFNAPGYNSGYHVKLMDGGGVLLQKSVTSISATFSSSGLKTGYRYNISIRTKSELYDDSYYTYDTFTTEFKTTPKLPDPPRNGACKDPTDISIDLDWDAPTNPNGDLVRYNIHVFGHDESTFTIVSTKGIETIITVDNLDPGTLSTFRIYTVNEVGKSDSYFTVNCKTNSKKMISSDECSSSTQTVIVGVVLGLIIILLLVHAGYATFLIRRYKAKAHRQTRPSMRNNRTSQTYRNESFLAGIVRTSDVMTIHERSVGGRKSTVSPNNLHSKRNHKNTRGAVA